MQNSQKNTFKKYLKSQIEKIDHQLSEIDAKKRAKVESDPTSKLENMSLSEVSTNQHDSWDVATAPNSTEISKPVLTEKVLNVASKDQENAHPNASEPTKKDLAEKSGEWNTMQLSEEARENAVFDNWIPPSQRRPEDEFYDLKQVKPIRVEEIEADGSL